jgi:hypothetical protein
LGYKIKILLCGSGMKKIQIRDPGWKKFGSGMEKNSDPGSGINNEHPGSATLPKFVL